MPLQARDVPALRTAPRFIHHRQQASSETSQLTLILDEESGMELLMGFVMTLCISLLIFHK